MIHISDEAAGLIRTLVADSGLPDSAGLRLGTDDQNHALAMDLTPEPREQDVVLRAEGATVFLSPVAAVRTGGQTLHAQVEGRPAFYLDRH
jgi:Fe-S cluster assembly iron-binding protein IscA